MPGGTCESTAVLAYGHITGAICVPLQNYHNMGPAGRIASEVIDLNDFTNELAWLVELVRQSAGRAEVNRSLARAMEDRFRRHRKLLTKWWPKN
jgi:hypothetical protein